MSPGLVPYFTHEEQTYTMYKVQLLTKIGNVCTVAVIDLL